MIVTTHTTFTFLVTLFLWLLLRRDHIYVHSRLTLIPHHVDTFPDLLITFYLIYPLRCDLPLPAVVRYDVYVSLPFGGLRLLRYVVLRCLISFDVYVALPDLRYTVAFYGAWIPLRDLTSLPILHSGYIVVMTLLFHTPHVHPLPVYR